MQQQNMTCSGFVLVLQIPSLLSNEQCKGPFRTEAEARAVAATQIEELEKAPFKMYATFTLRELKFEMPSGQPVILKEEIILSKWFGKNENDT